jgi:5-methylcytosine-specific restriction endonuclease McrA
MQRYLCSCGELLEKPGQHDHRPSSTKRGYNQQHQRMAALAIRAQPYCLDCSKTTDLTADHIVPLSKGGLNVPSNYEVRCRSCNSRRGNRFFEKGISRPRHRFSREKVQNVEP